MTEDFCPVNPNHRLSNGSNGLYCFACAETYSWDQLEKWEVDPDTLEPIQKAEGREV